ncbi:FAD-dependent oxidoreductase [Candidatus Dojkabacteria bacterium]|nr:FAD-dependent oxidoreductase [Candidatus Dojkabacteria bacterium]
MSKSIDNKNKIAIIGGGLTGLTAAYFLSQKGYSITVFEKSDKLGGLASTDEIANSQIEKTYHHIFQTDTKILKLIQKLKLAHLLRWENSSMAIYYKKRIFPFSSPIDLLKFKPLSPINRIRTGLVIFFLKIFKNWKKLSSVTAKEWLSKWNGKQAYKVIWEPLLKGKFHKYSNQISMAWLWARIHIRANTRNKTGNQELLGYLEGSFGVLIQELENQLSQNGVKIKLTSEIKSLTSKKCNKVILQSNNKTFKFDKCIATVPSVVFADLLNTNKYNYYINNLKDIDYLGAATLVFSSNQNIGDKYWYNINEISFPFLAFINHTNFIHKSFYDRKHIYYIGGYFPHDHEIFSKNESEIRQIWFTSLKKIFPQFDETQIHESKIYRFKFAQHIVNNSYKSKIPKYITPLDNVYLANFSQIYPEDRGMNFAVREGENIANIVAIDM